MEHECHVMIPSRPGLVSTLAKVNETNQNGPLLLSRGDFKQVSPRRTVIIYLSVPSMGYMS